MTVKPSRTTTTIDAETKRRFADACRLAGIRQSVAIDAAIADATEELVKNAVGDKCE